MIRRRFRILIADDHLVVRAGLRDILSHQPDLQIVGEACNGHEAVTAFSRLSPDLTIMDLRMPICGGVDAIRQIRQVHPNACILVLSSYEGDEDIHAALTAGAMGYILKHSSDDEIIPAIRRLLQGKQWIPNAIAKQLAARERSEALSERERQIVNLLVMGEANKEIGQTLGITELTVKSHMKNILAKLNVRDRTEAVTVALRRGIVHLPTE